MTGVKFAVCWDPKGKPKVSVVVWCAMTVPGLVTLMVRFLLFQASDSPNHSTP